MIWILLFAVGVPGVIGGAAVVLDPRRPLSHRLGFRYGVVAAVVLVVGGLWRLAEWGGMQ